MTSNQTDTPRFRGRSTTVVKARRTHAPNSRDAKYGRRTILRFIGAAALSGLIAGCVSDDTDGNGNVDYGEYLDESEEPDYDGWFDDVDNYRGTIDGRGEEEVTVAVGAEGGQSFGPPAILVDPGTRVVWEWTGNGGQHDVVHVDDDFESERTRSEGHTFERTFDDPGIERYVCVPHERAGMKGAVAVEE